MATQRYYVCGACHKKTWIANLFVALHDHANGQGHACESCALPMSIELTFNFGLGAGQHHCRVLTAFLPDQIVSWSNGNGGKVEFYPFLVIVESIDKGSSSVWLPYWHIVKHQDGSLEKKYGQWAPFIEVESYSSLVAKAKEAGYLWR